MISKEKKKKLKSNCRKFNWNEWQRIKVKWINPNAGNWNLNSRRPQHSNWNIGVCRILAAKYYTIPRGTYFCLLDCDRIRTSATADQTIMLKHLNSLYYYLMVSRIITLHHFNSRRRVIATECASKYYYYFQRYGDFLRFELIFRTIYSAQTQTHTGQLVLWLHHWCLVYIWMTR